MILAYVFVIIIPLIIVGIIILEAFRQSALNDATQQTIANVERVKARTIDVLDVSIDLSNRLSLDPKLEDIANRKYESVFDVVESYREYETFRTYMDFNQEISRIKLYTDNPTLISNWELLPLDRVTEQQFWYQAGMEGYGTIGWYYFDDITRARNSMLSLVRRIYFPEYKTTGMLVIDVNTNYLNSFLKQEPFETIILDERDTIVASNRPHMIGKKLSDTRLDEGIAARENGTHELVIDGINSKVYIEDIMPKTSYNGLKIISIFSVESIVAEANRISLIGFTVILISFAVSLILIYFICTILTNRLLNLNRQISKVSKGNFDSVLEVDGNDEIGLLSRQFNQMVYNIKELMEEVQRSNEQKNQLQLNQNEMKLKMLASQINPHFLYNALESIRMKAHINGEREIAQTVKLLGRLMRKNLEISGKKILLEEEIEIVRCYLAIQKFRHGDRLDFELNLDPGTEKISLPPLIVQPIVENAVIHGLERKPEGGKVKVDVSFADNGVRIKVSDDGIGLTQERLKAVMASLQNHEATRIGISNVHQRILLTYNSDCGFRIESAVNKGTVVQFVIPMEDGHV
ncbi:sensor histidine kinase [Paenibacillus tarimensis]